MARVFEGSFKKMAVELSYLKGSVLEAARELEIDASRLSKGVWIHVSTEALSFQRMIS